MYTSLKLSKLIKEAGCELESEFVWAKVLLYENGDFLGKDKPHKLVEYSKYNGGNMYTTEDSPAYDILNDICVKYTKEFFGMKYLMGHCGMDADESEEESGKGQRCCTFANSDCEWFEKAYFYHSKQIIKLLQQGKQEEAEQYIIDNSILFK